MAGGQTTGASGGSTPSNTVNPVTGYAPRNTYDPYSGYGPPPVATPATPFRELFMSSADRNRLAGERVQAAQQAQQQQIQSRQQQMGRELNYMFPGYQASRQMPPRSPFGGSGFMPFSYAPPPPPTQPNYYEPFYEPMQPRSLTQNYDMMPGGGIASLLRGLFR